MGIFIYFMIDEELHELTRKTRIDLFGIIVLTQ